MMKFQKEKKAAVAAALNAGSFIRKNLRRPKQVEYKGAINIVTNVDVRAEEMIVRRLKKDFPAYGILAEERPAEAGRSARWIIDPLDGTTNFAHQFPFFCVSIALEQDGRMVVGVVYDPVRDELFTAAAGEAARLNRQRIAVSRQARLDRAFLATGFSYQVREKKENNLDHFAAFIMRSMAVRRAGAAALDLCYVAGGRFDGFWELDLKPWDTAAAGLIIECAGGKISGFDGKPYDHAAGNMLASNGRLHRAMRAVLHRRPPALTSGKTGITS
ncbi:MAG: inositol monophosphatase [Candidatus Omnitrophica bacterium]|nr:inositol monophosphatase [Candidatus Omnitrophota bacterium]